MLGKNLEYYVWVISDFTDFSEEKFEMGMAEFHQNLVQPGIRRTGKIREFAEILRLQANLRGISIDNVPQQLCLDRIILFEVHAERVDGMTMVDFTQRGQPVKSLACGEEIIRTATGGAKYDRDVFHVGHPACK